MVDEVKENKYSNQQAGKVMYAANSHKKVFGAGDVLNDRLIKIIVAPVVNKLHKKRQLWYNCLLENIYNRLAQFFNLHIVQFYRC